MHPQSPPLTLGETVLGESVDLHIFGVTVDPMMTFEKHLPTVSSTASQLPSILRKSLQVFHDQSVLVKFFRGLSCQF